MYAHFTTCVCCNHLPLFLQEITQDAVGYHRDSLASEETNRSALTHHNVKRAQVTFIWLTLRWHVFGKRHVNAWRHPGVLLPEESEAEGPEHQRQPQVHFGSRLHVVLTSEHQGGVQSAEDKRFTPAGLNTRQHDVRPKLLKYKQCWNVNVGMFRFLNMGAEGNWYVFMFFDIQTKQSYIKINNQHFLQIKTSIIRF